MCRWRKTRRKVVFHMRQKQILFTLFTLLLVLLSIYPLFYGAAGIPYEGYDDALLVLLLSQLLVGLVFVLVPLLVLWMYRHLQGSAYGRHFLWLPAGVYLLCFAYAHLIWVADWLWIPRVARWLGGCSQFTLLLGILFVFFQIASYRLHPKEKAPSDARATESDGLS